MNRYNQSLITFIFILLFLTFFRTTIYSQNIHPFPGGGLTVSGIVEVLEFDTANNKLYAGGLFTSIEGIKANNIAVCDLATGHWSALKEGISGYVHAIKIMDDELFVGGYFKKAGNLEVGNIARWDGQDWYKMGEGVTNEYSYISGLEWYHDKLYACGAIYAVNGNPANHIITWDGEDWADAGWTFGLPPKELTVANDTLWAWGSAVNSLGGNSYSAGFLKVGQWTVLPAINNTNIATALSLINGSIYLSTGHNIIYKWEGGDWTIYYELPSGEQVRHIFLSENEIHVATGYSSGPKWEIKKLGSPSPLAVFTSPGLSSLKLTAAVAFNNKLWVGGQFSAINGESTASLASYSNVSWTSTLVKGINYFDSYQYAIGYSWASNPNGPGLFLGGRFHFAGETPAFNVAYWDGLSWYKVGKGLDATVRKLTWFNGALIACGNFTRSGSSNVNRIAQWNGTEWSSVQNGANKTVWDIEVFNGVLYAGGNFDSIGGKHIEYLAKFDGTNWLSAAAPIDMDNVTALAVHNGKLVAGDTHSNIWQLEGNAWVDISPPQDLFTIGSIADLFSFNGDLWASVYSAKPFLRWDGTSWQAVQDISFSSDESGRKFTLIGNYIVATVNNKGMFWLDNEVWKHPSQSPPWQPYDVFPVGGQKYYLTGFAPYIIDEHGQEEAHEGIGVLDFEPLELEISANQQTICELDSIQFESEHDALFIEYDWHFLGGVPEFSNEAMPIIQYPEPGEYPVWLVATTLIGVDTALLPFTIKVLEENSGCILADKESIKSSNLLNLYPNPTTNKLNLKLVDASAIDWQIFGIKGELMKSGVFATPNTDFVINTEELLPGMYWIRVQRPNAVIVQKFIKMN